MLDREDKKEKFKKYKKILYVEDGSIDLDDLVNQLDLHGNDDILVVPYRNGADTPELVDIDTESTTVNSIDNEYREKAKLALNKLIINDFSLTNRTFGYIQDDDIHHDDQYTFYGERDDILNKFLEYYNE